MEKGTSMASKYLRPGELLDMCLRINDGRISGYSCWEPMALSLKLLDYHLLTADRLASAALLDRSRCPSLLVPVLLNWGLVPSRGLGLHAPWPGKLVKPTMGKHCSLSDHCNHPTIARYRHRTRRAPGKRSCEGVTGASRPPLLSAQDRHTPRHLPV